MGISKIFQYFDKRKISYMYYRYEKRKHQGGAGFYHDGFYFVDMYKVMKVNGKSYDLEIKRTGRPAIRLWDGDRVAVIGFSQKEFIRQFESEFGR